MTEYSNPVISLDEYRASHSIVEYKAIETLSIDAVAIGERLEEVRRTALEDETRRFRDNMSVELFADTLHKMTQSALGNLGVTVTGSATELRADDE